MLVELKGSPSQTKIAGAAWTEVAAASCGQPTCSTTFRNRRPAASARSWLASLVADVVFAAIGSPGLFFFASTGCESSAFIAVPLARLAELCPALAEAAVELLFETCAPDLSACTAVLLLVEEPVL